MSWLTTFYLIGSIFTFWRSAVPLRRSTTTGTCVFLYFGNCIFWLVCFEQQAASVYIYTGPYKRKAFVGDGCPEISPLCLGLVPICFFFNAYGHTSGLMGCLGGSLQKGPLGLLESLLIVLCHSVFKNSLVQRLFTVSAICSDCFPEISQALWKTSILSEKMFVSTWARGGCENKHHLLMLEMWT